MNTSDAQILNAYEIEGMRPSEIAKEFDFDVVAIKAKLMQISSAYRKDCGQESEEDTELNFSNEQLKKVTDVIFETAISAEDPNLRFKAACYVRDDKKGRKEVVRAVQNNNWNILQINEALQNAKAGAVKVKEAILLNK